MDVTVVGGGVLGTMHAWIALERGHRVLQIERDAEARSASVRNFGLIWVSGRRDGPELDLARRARELWAEIASDVPRLGFRPNGSLTVALDDTELAVMERFAATPAATDRGIELLCRDDARALNPGLGRDITGALHCRLDGAVEPRTAQRVLHDAMRETGRYRFLPNRHVVGREGTWAIDHHGERHRGDALVICPGAVHDALASEHLATAPVRRCRLQMLQTEPLDVALTTSIADADSMRYYPAYEHVDLSALPPQPPVAAAARAQLLLVQRLDGTLTIGDTHAYDDESDEPFDFDLDEAATDHLVAKAADILGRPLPPVRRRWAGVYSQLSDRAAPDAVVHRAVLEPGVVVVTGPGGRGMTLAPAIAERTWVDRTWEEVS